jgi:hypothetical protein
MPGQQAKYEKSEKLRCGDYKSDPGGMLFKSGTAEKQHIVEVLPKGSGAEFTGRKEEARLIQKCLK